MQMPEDDSLGEALDRVHPGGKADSRFLRHDVGEVERELALGFGPAVEHIRTVLTGLTGGHAEPDALLAGHDRAVGRVVVGGGFFAMNPVVVTVTATRNGEHATAVHVRAVAPEGLIKQRAGRKTAARVMALLDGAGR
jgi:hypothetical protein